MNTNFMYYGLFLTDESRNLLLNKLSNVLNGKVFLHHITLGHRYSTKESVENMILWNKLGEFYEKHHGEKYKVTLTAIGQSDKAMAYKASIPDLPCINKMPHLTIQTFDGGKPVDSNYITNWVEIDPIEIETYFEKN